MKYLLPILLTFILANQVQADTKTTIGQNAKNIITLFVENGVQEDVYGSYPEGIIAWHLKDVSCFSRSNSAIEPETKYYLIPDVSCENLPLGRTASRRFMDVMGNLPFDYIDCALGGQCGLGQLEMLCQIDTKKYGDFRFQCTINRTLK